MKIHIIFLVCGISFKTTTSTPAIDNITSNNYDIFQEIDPKSRTYRSVNFPGFFAARKTPANNYRATNPRDVFDFLRDEYPLPPGVSSPLKEYDFIVIGAGSTGSVLASRLSENKKWSVLLLEAGGPEIVFSDVPLMAAYLQETDYNWGYRQERQEGLCMGMEEQRCAMPRGKGIGGSSLINYMIYTRGNRLDWDRIAEAGNPGWSFDEVMPHYLKSERANMKGLEYSRFHNRDGLLNIEHVPFRTPLGKAFLKAGRELGHPTIDYNEGHSYGFGRVQGTLKNGRRTSVAKAFLHPFKKRKNLHILHHTRAIKININKKSNTAKSVIYVRNKLEYTVKARKEIIVSAGALSSPKLLMLSGVGPKKHLEEIGIDVIKDLKVGETIYDHVFFPGLIFLINTTGVSYIESNVISVKNIMDFIRKGEGPLTSLGGIEAIGYIQTSKSEEKVYQPDIEYLFLPGGIISDASSAIRKGMKISDRFFNEAYRGVIERESWTLAPILLHPKSKGYLRLRDKNPYRFPKIYYDFFSDRRDLDTMIEAIKYAIKLSNTDALKKFGSVLYDKQFPTCLDRRFGTDDYWECALRTLATSDHHQIGTCKMGPRSDPEAVVDHELKVHGIDKLRVADTSVIPLSLSAHTNAPAIMIGEKLADILKKNWE